MSCLCDWLCVLDVCVGCVCWLCLLVVCVGCVGWLCVLPLFVSCVAVCVGCCVCWLYFLVMGVVVLMVVCVGCEVGCEVGCDCWLCVWLELCIHYIDYLTYYLHREKHLDMEILSVVLVFILQNSYTLKMFGSTEHFKFVLMEMKQQTIIIYCISYICISNYKTIFISPPTSHVYPNSGLSLVAA